MVVLYVRKSRPQEKKRPKLPRHYHAYTHESDFLIQNVSFDALRVNSKNGHQK